MTVRVSIKQPRRGRAAKTTAAARLRFTVLIELEADVCTYLPVCIRSNGFPRSRDINQTSEAKQPSSSVVFKSGNSWKSLSGLSGEVRLVKPTQMDFSTKRNSFYLQRRCNIMKLFSI